jgi:ligand-binding SRPBCC domain-containing protein
MPAKTHRLYRKTRVPAPLDEVFGFFSRAENLDRITPPWLHFRILSSTPLSLSLGTHIDLALKLHRFPVHWRTEITGWDPPHSFEDTQIRGPYRQWVHFHHFSSEEDGTLMEDAVVYRCPGGIFEPLVDFWFVRRRLESIFDYREEQLQAIFQEAKPLDRADEHTPTSG